MTRAIRLLNLRRLARVRLRLVVAIVAVAAGSSLALSVVIVNGSATYSLNRISTQVAGGAGLRVVGATSVGGITFHALAATAHMPGVRIAIPVVEAVSAVRTTGSHHQSVLVVGIDCLAAAPAGLGCAGASNPAAATPGGAAKEAPTAIYVAQSLHSQLGRDSWLETDVGLRDLTRALPLRRLNDVNHGDVVIMPLAAAQTAFARRGTVDDIYVVPDHGVSLETLQRRLAAAVGPWDGVVPATALPPAVTLALGEFTPVLFLLALVASGIAVVLVYNIITLSLEERRRERAIVAAVGASPGTLIVGPLIEAGALGAVGGLVGTLGGLVLAKPILSTLASIIEGLVGAPITEHITADTFIFGVVLGTVIGLVAAAVPIRRSMRVDIAAELSGREQRAKASRNATVRRGLLYLVLACAGALVSWLGARNGSLEPWQPNAALFGFVVATVLAILALGAWAPVTIRGLWRRGGIRQGVGRLGVANLVREPGRTGVMAIAIGAAVGVAFITASYNRAIDQNIASSFGSSPAAHSILVSTVAAGTNGFNEDGQIPAPVQAALGRLPGVARVDQFRGTLTGHSANQLVLIETDTQPVFSEWTLYAGTASPASFRQGQVLVGASLARRDHLHAGSHLTLDTPAGLATVKIQGIWSNGDATGDNVFMSSHEAQNLYGPQGSPAIRLIIARGASPSAVLREARAAHLGSYLKFSTPSKQLRDADSSISSQLAPFNVLQRALLLVSFISVLSTLLLVGVQRRREFGLLAAVGASPRHLFRMVLAEGLTVSVVGVVLGALFGFGVLALILDVTPLLVGYVDTYSPDFGSLVVYGPIAVVVAVAAACWPGRLAARTPILEALTYE